MKNSRPHPESGNVIFFILLGIVLIALVTAAIRSGSESSGDVDQEATTLDVTKIKQYASELERGVVFVLNNGASETDVRFAYADASSDYGDITLTPNFQVFSPQGGGAEYRAPPSGDNDGSPWEFYGNTALPLVGSDKPELIAVLPNVTATLCARIDKMDGLPAMPQISGSCINPGSGFRFSPTVQYKDSSPNIVAPATFSSGKPTLDACVACGDGTYNYFHVLHAR